MSDKELNDLREKVADELYGGGCDSSHWPEALEMADKIIVMVLEYKGEVK